MNLQQLLVNTLSRTYLLRVTSLNLKILVLFVSMMTIGVMSCKIRDVNNNVDSPYSERLIKVKVVTSFGNAVNDSLPVYYPSIVNHGEMIDGEGVQVLILGEAIDEGNVENALPIGSFAYIQDEVSKKYVLASRIVDGQSEYPDNFLDFSTKFPSIKKMIELYFNNFMGMGKTKFVKWEDEGYARGLIETHNED